VTKTTLQRNVSYNNAQMPQDQISMSTINLFQFLLTRQPDCEPNHQTQQPTTDESCSWNV